MQTSGLIQLKGIREGLLIIAESGDWESRFFEILNLVKDKGDFFKDARVFLDVGETNLRVIEITQLRDRLADLQVILWGILSESESTQSNTKALGLVTNLPAKKVSINKGEGSDDAETAVLIHKTLRAGYRIESNDHVIIFGDVNPGAEVVSAGNILVWGKLKGSAMAGSTGNTLAVICAIELIPTQMRIGEIIFPPVQRKGKIQPEMAIIKNDECVIEIWNKEKER